MKITIADTLTIGEESMSSLSVSALRRVLGLPDSCEETRMHGGGTRYREKWTCLNLIYHPSQSTISALQKL